MSGTVVLYRNLMPLEYTEREHISYNPSHVQFSSHDISDIFRSFDAAIAPIPRRRMFRRATRTEPMRATVQKVKHANLEDAKHFKWTLTDPAGRNRGFPGRIYRPALAQVGGIVVVMAQIVPEWQETRVLFYNIKKHSWGIVHAHGPLKAGSADIAPSVGVVGDQLFLLYQAPHVHCFDLVLREWIPCDVPSSSFERFSSVKCFVEGINSFICVDQANGAVSVLNIEKLRWVDHATKGEWSRGVGRYPDICSHGHAAYLAWRDQDRQTELRILTCRNEKFYWSKPAIRGFRPSHNSGCTITYAAGRLFKVGGFNSLSDSVHVYSIDRAEWHKVANDSSCEYSMRGKMPQAGSHATIGLNDKLIVFGGVSVVFKTCRIFEPV